MNLAKRRVASMVGLLVALALVGWAGTAAGQNMDKGTFDAGDIGGGGGGDGTVSGATQVLDPPWAGESFGSSVDANGGTTAGKTLIANDRYALNAGTWYFQDGAWSHTHTFSLNCGTFMDTQSVSIDGDTAVIADMDSSCSSDIIKVYHRSAVGDWTQTAVLDVPAENVEVSGDFIAYGDPGGSGDAQWGIFRKESVGEWTEVWHVRDGSKTGGSVAVQDPDLGLAAFGNNNHDSSTYQVRVYRENLDGSWSKVQTISNSCGTLQPDCPVTFGEHVDIAPTSEHKLAAGAPLANDNDGDGNYDEGDAYTFVDTGGYNDPYAFESNLTPDDDQDNLQFGDSANAWDGSSIVGATGFNGGDGTVYAFEAGTLQVQLEPENPGGDFGEAVHYSGDYALVGAPDHGTEGYVGYFN